MDLISPADKYAYSNVFNNMHDTFARPIIIWQTPKTTLIATQPEYNFLYEQQVSLIENYVPVSGVFKARVHWLNPEKVYEWRGDDVRDYIDENFCSVKIQADALSFITGAESIMIDGRNVKMIGSQQLQGLFSGDFYRIMLKESK